MAAAKSPADITLSGAAMHTIYRDYIKHEDTLVQYRTTWLLVLTGMLLTTYITLYGLMIYIMISAPRGREEFTLVDYSATSLLFIPIFLISSIGFIASVICFRSILGASKSVKSIQAAWKRFQKSSHWTEKDRFLPELTFGFSRPITPPYGYPKTVCVVVGMMWLISVGANIFLVDFFRLSRSGLVGG